MTQAQKDADDIIEAATQAEQFPTPYSHRQMRMATQIASQKQGELFPSMTKYIAEAALCNPLFLFGVKLFLCWVPLYSESWMNYAALYMAFRH